MDGVNLSNLNGQKFKLTGIFSDKPIMFVFWSIRCGTCIEEIPFIINLHNKFKEKLTIVGVHPTGFPLKKIHRFLRKFPQKIPYMLAIDENMSLCKTYQVSVLPKIVMINKQGKVLYSHLGYEQTKEKEVEDAIKSKL